MTAASDAFDNGSASESETIRNERRLATTGSAIGILHINSNFPLVPGNAQNAATFDFPVRYQQVDGLSASDLLSGSLTGTTQVVEAALALQDAGVGAIVGACGSFVNYQSAIADAVEIPVFSSVLVTVPLLLSSLGSNQKLGIVFASSESFTDNVRKESGLTDTERLVIADCRSLEAFQPILQNEDFLNSRDLEKQLVGLVKSLVSGNPDVGALVLQCSELPPYAPKIHKATGLPVFDITTLTRWVHDSIVRKAYAQ